MLGYIPDTTHVNESIIFVFHPQYKNEPVVVGCCKLKFTTSLYIDNDWGGNQRLPHSMTIKNPRRKYQ